MRRMHVTPINNKRNSAISKCFVKKKSFFFTIPSSGADNENLVRRTEDSGGAEMEVHVYPDLNGRLGCAVSRFVCSCVHARVCVHLCVCTRLHLMVCQVFSRGYALLYMCMPYFVSTMHQTTSCIIIQIHKYYRSIKTYFISTWPEDAILAGQHREANSR